MVPGATPACQPIITFYVINAEMESIHLEMSNNLTILLNLILKKKKSGLCSICAFLYFYFSGNLFLLYFIKFCDRLGILPQIVGESINRSCRGRFSQHFMQNL